jgi:hypothetical protein
MEDSLLMLSDARRGTVYLLLGTSTTGPASVGNPSVSHLGRPPSSTLDWS